MGALRKVLIAIGVIVAFVIMGRGFVDLLSDSYAQTTTIPAARAVVVAVCGTAPWTFTAGQEQPLTMNVNGQLCVNP